MRRQRRTPHYFYDNDCNEGKAAMTDVASEISHNALPMERLPRDRFENTIEAKVEDGDTLQAMALRFHCTVTDIKRLNKIDKDNEIYARKVVKIPLTVQSVLLETLPIVHKSGNNSPNRVTYKTEADPVANIRNPLEDEHIMLSEKLMVASVNSSTSTSNGINNANTILNSKIGTNLSLYENEATLHTKLSAEITDPGEPLLDQILHDETAPRIRQLRGPPLSAIDWSGSDCDMSWICLFIVILALCFVIPLIYVIYLAEHSHQHHDSSGH